MNSEKVNEPNLANFLRFGMKLSSVIDFGPNNQYNFSGTFIGLKENSYLIFELSVKAMEDLVTKKLNGLNIVLRGVTDTEEGHVIAFRSRILGVKSIGPWLVFLEYPGKVEAKAIRSEKRYKVRIPASVTVGEDSYDAELVDVSISGCAVYINEKLDVETGQEIFIDPETDNIPKPYPKTHIVNVRTHQEGVLLGVELEEPLVMTDELRLEIFSYLVSEK